MSTNARQIAQGAAIALVLATGVAGGLVSGALASGDPVASAVISPAANVVLPDPTTAPDTATPVDPTPQVPAPAPVTPVDPAPQAPAPVTVTPQAPARSHVSRAS